MIKLDDSFKDYIVEQLRDVPALKVRPMFGGFGLYMGERFFGIISDESVYFKTSDKTREKYERYGSSFFRPNEKQALKNYYEVPGDVLEDREKLTAWAEQAAGF